MSLFIKQEMINDTKIVKKCLPIPQGKRPFNKSQRNAIIAAYGLKVQHKFEDFPDFAQEDLICLCFWGDQKLNRFYCRSCGSCSTMHIGEVAIECSIIKNQRRLDKELLKEYIGNLHGKIERKALIISGYNIQYIYAPYDLTVMPKMIPEYYRMVKPKTDPIIIKEEKNKKCSPFFNNNNTTNTTTNTFCSDHKCCCQHQNHSFSTVVTDTANTYGSLPLLPSHPSMNKKKEEPLFLSTKKKNKKRSHIIDLDEEEEKNQEKYSDIEDIVETIDLTNANSSTALNKSANENKHLEKSDFMPFGNDDHLVSDKKELPITKPATVNSFSFASPVVYNKSNTNEINTKKRKEPMSSPETTNVFSEAIPTTMTNGDLAKLVQEARERKKRRLNE